MAEYVVVDKGSGNKKEDGHTVLEINKIKNVVDLIDFLQRRSALESQSRSIRKMSSIFTIKDYGYLFVLAIKEALGFEFFVLGFIGFTVYVLYNSGIWTPFPNVEQKWLVFLFVNLFTFSTQLSYMFAILYMTRHYYRGIVPKKAIEAYTIGKVVGYFLKIVFLLLLAYFGYRFFMDPKTIEFMVLNLAKIFKKYDIDTIYRSYLLVVDSYKSDMVRASFIIMFFNIVLLASYFYVRNRSQNITEVEENPLSVDTSFNSKMLDINFVKSAEGVVLGKGIKLYPSEPFPDIVDIVLYDRYRNRNTAVIGTVGTGKTMTMLNIAGYDILKGDNVIIIDPKGSGEVFNYVFQTCLIADRLEDFIYINPLFPEVSAKINPLAYYSFPDVVINTIVNAVKAKDEFFVNIAREMITVIVYSLVEIDKYTQSESKFNFRKINEYVSRDKLEELMSSLSVIQTEDARHLVNQIKKILATPPEYFAKVASTLRVLLTVLTTGRIGQVIGDSYENDFMYRIMHGKGVVMLVETGSMLSKYSASVIARMVLSNLTTFAGQYYAERKKFPKPVKVHVDEFYTALFDGIENLFDKGREVGVAMNVYFQSISQLYAELPKEKADIVMDTINNYILFRVKSPETAEYFAEMVGKGKQFLTNVHSDGSLSMIEREDWIILPGDFLRLPDRTFVFISSGENSVYKGKTLDIPQTVIKVSMPDLISRYVKEAPYRSNVSLNSVLGN
jgi:type IV secretory pathway TraG/TraD family ATPase VirD4